MANQLKASYSFQQGIFFLANQTLTLCVAVGFLASRMDKHDIFGLNMLDKQLN